LKHAQALTKKYAATKTNITWKNDVSRPVTKYIHKYMHIHEP